MNATVPSFSPLPSGLPRPAKPSANSGAGLDYTQALALARQGQIGNAVIELPRQPWEGTPQARLHLLNGTQSTVRLPSVEGPLTQSLLDTQTPLSFRPQQQDRRTQAKAALQGFVQETGLPIVAFSALSIVSWLGYGKATAWLKTRQTEATLREAVKQFAGPAPDLDHLLKAYSAPVRAVMQKFRDNRAAGVILDGPPGNGKTTLLEAAAQELLAHQPAIALNIREPEVRNLLSRLYMGTGSEQAGALGSLRRIAGKPVEHIILVVDELERYWGELSTFFVDSLSNGQQSSNLPKLRPLLSGNDRLALSGATESRVNHWRGFVDYFDPAENARFVGGQLAHHLKDAPEALPSAHLPNAQQWTEFFQANPGYSRRRLVEGLADVSEQIRAKHLEGAQPVLEAYEAALGPLTGTEIAGLARTKLVEALTQTQSSLTPDQVAMLHHANFKEAETVFLDMGMKLNLPSRAINRHLDRLLADNPSWTQPLTQPKELVYRLTDLKEGLNQAVLQPPSVH